MIYIVDDKDVLEEDIRLAEVPRLAEIERKKAAAALEEEKAAAEEEMRLAEVAWEKEIEKIEALRITA